MSWKVVQNLQSKYPSGYHLQFFDWSNSSWALVSKLARGFNFTVKWTIWTELSIRHFCTIIDEPVSFLSLFYLPTYLPTYMYLPTYLPTYMYRPTYMYLPTYLPTCTYLPQEGEVLPYKGLMGTCGQPGYVFRDFCLKQGIKFIIYCLNQGIGLSIFVLNRISFLGRSTAKFLQALVN